jgi:ATP-dependent exoDNAse (exonuclease V) alpha subunit
LLGQVELDVGGNAFAIGDRIVVRRNDHRLDVRNGDRGVVTAVDPAARTLTARIGDRERTLPHAFLDGRTRSGDPVVQHGYAITAYVAQGLTCRAALVLMHDDADREWVYTTMSRGRERNQLYTVVSNARDRLEYAPVEPNRDPERQLTVALYRTRQQQLALDQAADVLRRARTHEEFARILERREAKRGAERTLGREL